MRYLKDKPLLYDKHVAGRNLPWYEADDLKNYNKYNKKGWNYYNSVTTLEYNFNKLGYRTCEFDNLPQDYVLVSGCSYTEGVGLHENEIWCGQVAKRLNVPIVNLAKSGTGPDIVNFNMQLFVKNKFTLPRAVIIQWPNVMRKTFGYVHAEGLHLQDRNIHSVPDISDETTHEKRDGDWFFKRWAQEDGQMEYENSLHIISTTNLWNALGVPVYNWTFQGDFEKWHDQKLCKVIKTDITERARDMAHDGPDVHKQVVDQIEDDLRCMI